MKTIEERALEMAKKKLIRHGYEQEYMPDLYQEAVASLKLQEKTRGSK